MPEYVIGLTGDQQRQLQDMLRGARPYGDKMVRFFRVTLSDVTPEPRPPGFVGPFGEGSDA